MVKFIGHTDDGRIVVGLGLSRLNTVRLLAGRPIRVALDGAVPEGCNLPFPVDVVLIGGETETAIARDLQRVAQRPDCSSNGEPNA